MSFVALPTTFVRLHVRMPSPLLHSKSLLPHLTSVATDEVWSAVRAFCFGQQNARRIVASQGVGHKFRQFALPGCRQNPSSPVEASRTPAFSVWFSLHLMTSHPAHREHGHGDRWLAAGRLRLFTQPKTTGRGKQNIYKNTSCPSTVLKDSLSRSYQAEKGRGVWSKSRIREPGVADTARPRQPSPSGYTLLGRLGSLQ